MKAYGREKNLRGYGEWKVDYHPRPKKKLQNWWEGIISPLTRGAMKHKVKKEIENEINDNLY